MSFRPYGRIKALFNACAIIIMLAPALAKTETRTSDMVVLAFGDSLTAGYGVASAESFPVLLETRLRQNGAAVRVLNAGVSGDTTAGGAARIEWALAEKPDLVILELGANDGLRGVDPAVTQQNLAKIYNRATAAGARVLLMGMRASPSMGTDYETAFNAVFPALAQSWRVGFYPFFLEGVAADPAFTQPDGLHPNAKGVAIIVEGVAPLVHNEYHRWKKRTR